MATTPNKPDPRTVVKTSERLWSEVVGAAQPEDIVKTGEPAYEFSNGRNFVDPKRPPGGGNG